MATQPYQLPDIASAAARYAQRGAAAVGRGLGATGRFAFRHTPVGGLMEDEPGIMPALRTGVSSLTPQAAPRPEPVSIEGHADRLMDSQQSSYDPMDSAIRRFSGPDPAESRRVLAGGDFRSMQPDWGTDVSAAQLAIDDDARSDLFERHQRRLREIQAEDDLRGDPMDDAIRRQGQRMAYERNLPAGATSRVHAWQRTPEGGMDPVESEGVGVRPLGGYTMGEEQQNRSAIQLAQARLNPKDTAEGALGMGRGRLVEELAALRADLESDIQSGARTPEAAQAEWARAVKQVETMVTMLKAGFPRPDALTGE